MKMFKICATLAMAALAAAPVMAAGPALDKAAALAAQDSGASLSEICYAAYQAGKEAPGEAHVVLGRLLEQRTTWSAGEVYAIMRALFFAYPELEQEYNLRSVAPAGSEGTGDAAATAEAEENSMLSKCLVALHEALLPEGVAPAVMNALANNAIDLVVVNQNVVSGRTGGSGSTSGDTSSFETPSITPPTPSIPSEGDMSGQN